MAIFGYGNGSTLVILLTLFTDVILAECSATCTSCSGSTCSSCESSYYLSNGGFCSPCQDDCKSCSGFDNCTSCQPNKWGLLNRCEFDCDSRCTDANCLDDTGFCVQCKPGQYGFRCQHNCSYCADELCDLRRCVQGCKQGYYEYKTASESFCQKCPHDCKYCNDPNMCRVCNDGFYLYKFYSSGKIVVFCISCYTRPNCSNYCAIQNCDQCQIQNDALVCTDCPEGQRFNGVTCLPNIISCSHECSSYCDDDGICLGSCNAGWTGDRCSNKCSDKCLLCDKINGNICLQCKGDSYTTNCSVICNPSCTKENGKQTCRLNDGFCLNGCEYKFWGPICNQPCSEGCADIGISLTCDRSNGTCTNGCKEGYTGDKCDVTDTSKTTGKTEATSTAATTQTQICMQRKCEENVSSTNTFVVGFFSGLGTSIIVAAITVTFYQLRRRFIAQQLTSYQESDHIAEMPTYNNDDGTGNASATREPDNETNSYERLGRSRNTDQVYSDLETTQVQQSASYYNMGIGT